MLTAKDFEPDEGWYKHDTEKTINGVIKKLKSEDVSEEVIEDIIEDLISAIMSEYGE